MKPLEAKSFPVGVYELPGEMGFRQGVPDETMALVAEVVTFEVEYRAFVSDRGIEAMSVYLREGELARDEDGNWLTTPDESSEARSFAERLLKEESIEFPKAVVLDVGRIANRGWAAVELNAAWGSGIYGCEPNAVLRVIENATLRN